MLESNKIDTRKIEWKQCWHARMREVILAILGGEWVFLSGTKSKSLKLNKPAYDKILGPRLFLSCPKGPGAKFDKNVS
jgi:hypothetical protein